MLGTFWHRLMFPLYFIRSGRFFSKFNRKLTGTFFLPYVSHPFSITPLSITSNTFLAMNWISTIANLSTQLQGNGHVDSLIWGNRPPITSHRYHPGKPLIAWNLVNVNFLEFCREFSFMSKFMRLLSWNPGFAGANKVSPLGLYTFISKLLHPINF